MGRHVLESTLLSRHRLQVIVNNIIKPTSTTKEKRVALDLLDVREGIEKMGDQIRWVPTDHMLVDCLTKSMNPFYHDEVYE